MRIKWFYLLFTYLYIFSLNFRFFIICFRPLCCNIAHPLGKKFWKINKNIFLFNRLSILLLNQ